MKNMKVREKVLQDMAKVFLKELFYNIPYVPVHLTELEDGYNGVFCIDRGPDYIQDEDELINAPEYKRKYKLLWDGLCGVDMGGDESYMDPLNHPDVYIKISCRITADIRKTVSVLLHELLHYFYWYTGREYHDDDREFLDKCKEMGVPTNYTDFEWNGSKWVDTYDYTQIDKYLMLYVGELQESEVA